MDWSNFSFNGVGGLQMVTQSGQSDPHWWSQLQVESQHCDGSNRNIHINLGRNAETLEGQIFGTGESTLTALINAQGTGTLDGRSVLMQVMGKPETNLAGDQMSWWLPVKFTRI